MVVILSRSKDFTSYPLYEDAFAIPRNEDLHSHETLHLRVDRLHFLLRISVFIAFVVSDPDLCDFVVRTLNVGQRRRHFTSQLTMDHLPKHPEHPPEEDPARSPGEHDRHSPRGSATGNISHRDVDSSDCALDLRKKKKLSPEVPPPPSSSGASPSVPWNLRSQRATHFMSSSSHPEPAASVAAAAGVTSFSVPKWEVPRDSPGLAYPSASGLPQSRGQKRRYPTRGKKVEATATTSKPTEEGNKATPVPDQQKVDADEERRRRRNESSKRSWDKKKQTEKNLKSRVTALENGIRSLQEKVKTLSDGIHKLVSLLSERGSLEQKENH